MDTHLKQFEKECIERLAEKSRILAKKRKIWRKINIVLTIIMLLIFITMITSCGSNMKACNAYANKIIKTENL